MNIFKTLKFSFKSETDRVPREMLPALHAFVEVAIGESRRRESIPVEAIAADTFTTRALPGLQTGGTADFLYSNPAGRFRFSTVCVAQDADQAHFKMPVNVRTLASYGAKRSAVRLESTRPVQWRFAPDSNWNGTFVKGSMTDLSCAGAALLVDRDLDIGVKIEIAFSLESSTAPVVVLGEVARAAKNKTSAKRTVGIRFLALDTSAESAINTFIVNRQALRRKRGVA